MLFGLFALMPSLAHAAATSHGSFRCPPVAAPGYCGDRGPAVQAGLGGPTDVAMRPDGSYLVADAVNNVVRLVSRGRITTVAGGGSASGGAGNARRARLRFPAGIATLSGNRFLIADTGNNRVLLVEPNGQFSTVAGDVVPGHRGDGGPAARARLRSPMAVAPTEDGGVLIADTGNHRVRMARADGTITTVAGTGRRGSGGDRGPAALATLDRPIDVTATPGGSFLVATADGRVRDVGADGIIRTLLWDALAGASRIAALSDGAVLVSQSRARRILRIGHDGMQQAVAFGGLCGGPHRERPADRAGFGVLSGVAAAADGDVFVADTGARRILRIDGGRVYVDAGAGLGVPKAACDREGAPEYLPATTPLAPGAVDPQYPPAPGPPAPGPPPPGPPPPGPSPGGGGGGPPPSRLCSRGPALFRLRFGYIEQRGRVTRRPRARRPFSVLFYVGTRAQVWLSVERGGRARWRIPRTGTVTRQGAAKFRLPGLRPGRYRLRLRADSSVHRQRLCIDLRLRVRRR
jgi:sugar lactone lactonase YvrE